ncbi:MAG: hypothetical protein ABJK28_01165 [Algibacter sp.]
MNNLNHVVSTFSAENQQRFITFLEKKNKRKDIKNIQLFKLLLKNELNSKAICLAIYGSYKKDAYHALRMRLYHSIIDFTANTSLQEENSVNMKIIKYLIASRTYLQLKEYKVAYKVLDKAEALAQEHQLFPILNEIYHTKIQYAYANPILDLDAVIIKFKKNKASHQKEDELNIVYAKIRQTLNNINYKSDVLDFQTILNNTLKAHHVNIDNNLSFKSLYQLIAIVSLSAFVTKDYLKIESFLLNAYKSIIQNKKKDPQVYYHIQILYLIANTLFRNKKFEDSEHYLGLMHQQMHEEQKKYFNRFKLKYNLLLALTFNFTNKQDCAIDLLLPFINIKHPDIESLLDIHLSLTMFYFQKNALKKAQALLSKLNHNDKWYNDKAGTEWIIKKRLLEILLHIELENIDLVESRLLSFKRSYSKYLKDIKQERVLIYLGLIEACYKNPENINSIPFKSTVEKSFEWIHPDEEDIFVMSFYAWLKSKIERQPIYKTTLELIYKYEHQN